ASRRRPSPNRRPAPPRHREAAGSRVECRAAAPLSRRSPARAEGRYVTRSVSGRARACLRPEPRSWWRAFAAAGAARARAPRPLTEDDVDDGVAAENADRLAVVAEDGD